MKYLLDTHTLIWLLRSPELLSQQVAAVIEQARGRAMVSVVTLWEIAINYSIGKLQLPRPYDQIFPLFVHESGLTLLAIEPSHLATVSKLPLHHRDPFDRLLIAQAMSEGLTMVSRDPQL